MVQYVHTPWRNQAELLEVRRQLYPSRSAATTAAPAAAISSNEKTEKLIPSDDQRQQQQRQHAVSRVSMWMQRGNCPHMVESTALLTAAMLDDLRETRGGSSFSSSTSAVRLAYTAAFSRFVTGLLDSHQDKQQKQSMYTLAKAVGLPAAFVEMRHQCAHEHLPSLTRLRAVAEKSLDWIWDRYWRHLQATETEGRMDEDTSLHACRDLLVNRLSAEEWSAETLESLLRQLRPLSQTKVLQILAEIGDCAEDLKLILRSTQLSRAFVDGADGNKHNETPVSRIQSGDVNRAIDLEAMKGEIIAAQTKLDGLDVIQKGIRPSNQPADGPVTKQNAIEGWSRYEGAWKAKPIGIV